jgi:hypothetical protein
MLPNKYWNFLLLGDAIEIFTANQGDMIIITGGRVESIQNQITGLQVIIPIGGAHPIKVSVSNMTSVLTPDIISNILLSVSTPSTTPASTSSAEIVKFQMDTTRIIHNYMNDMLRNEEPTVKVNNDPIKLKLSVRQAKLKLVMNQQQGIEILIDCLKLQKFQSDKMIIGLDRFVCLDRIVHSVWNQAIIIRKLQIYLENNNYQVLVGENDSSPNRYEDVTVSLDQNLVDYASEFLSAIRFPVQPQQQTTELTFHSFYIAPFKARIDYKPSATSGYFRFVPLRGAVIKMNLFESFDVTAERLGVELALHILNHFRNIPRIVSGIKPLRAPANIFRNIAELVLVPLEEGRNLDGIIAQAKHAAVATVISVLELGPALSVRRVGATGNGALTSVHSMQPNGIKGGFIQAGQNFKTDMTTVFAFISGDLRNVDLFDLPLMVLRPLTTPLADIINGMCNQLDPNRYKRQLDKYR